MSEPANVIQIIDSLSVGGAEMMAVNIANGLSERKINIREIGMNINSNN